MKHIVLLGPGFLGRDGDFLKRNLQRRFSVTAVEERRVETAGEGPPLLLSLSPKPLTILGEKALVLLHPGMRLSGVPAFPPDSLFLADSGSRRQMGVLARAGAQTAACGLSGRDTLTFSSRGEDRAVISLLRAVKTLQGETVEPMDFPVAFSGDPPDYLLLFGAGCLILSGALPEGEDEIQNFASYKKAKER